MNAQLSASLPRWLYECGARGERYATLFCTALRCLLSHSRDTIHPGDTYRIRTVETRVARSAIFLFTTPLTIPLSIFVVCDFFESRNSSDAALNFTLWRNI